MNRREFFKNESLRIFKEKVNLELTMRRSLRSYFNKQRKRIRNGDNFGSISSVLDEHYKRIIRKYLHKNVKQIDRIDESVRIFFENKANNQAQEIDNTTQGILEKSIDEARQQLFEEGNTTPTEREIMIAASVIFARKNRVRVTTIANTETQTNVEGLRQQITIKAHEDLEDVIVDRDKKKAKEIYELSRDYTSYEISKKIDTADTAVLMAILLSASKIWRTMGDNKVRSYLKGDKFDHVTANKQVKRILEPYIVSGQLMMYPGDFSLGATIGNIANCRCVSIYL